MRVGKNPTLKEKLINTRYNHQVIIPVYIPNAEDYFKDSFKIFKRCLDSLILTSNDFTFITIVNNGSADYVVEYLNDYQNKGKIHEVIHTVNIGKTNAIFKGLQGHNFPFVTISDADVMFLKGWQKATFKIFDAFKKAGVVGLIPQLKMHDYLCSNILFDCFFSSKLRFTEVLNPKGIEHFLKSIGWNDNYNKNYLKKHLTITSLSGEQAVLGTGHVVATYRNWALPKKIVSVEEKLSPKYDKLFLDTHVLKYDGWRLTTADNYAYHMGNVWESWMCIDEDFSEKLSDNDIVNVEESDKSKNDFKYFIKIKLFKKLLSVKLLMRLFLRFKGLPKSMINNY